MESLLFRKVLFTKKDILDNCFEKDKNKEFDKDINKTWKRIRISIIFEADGYKFKKRDIFVSIR